MENNTTTDSLNTDRFRLTERLGNLRNDRMAFPPLQSGRWFAEEISAVEGELAHVERCVDSDGRGLVAKAVR